MKGVNLASLDAVPIKLPSCNNEVSLPQIIQDSYISYVCTQFGGGAGQGANFKHLPYPPYQNIP